MTLPFGWKSMNKNRGDRAECLAARQKPILLQIPLISAIVALYLLNLATSASFVRTHLDKRQNLHSNGDLNQRLISSHGDIC